MNVGQRTRRILSYVATAAAGFLLAYLIVAFYIFPNSAGDADVTVPGVIGLTQGDAQRKLASAGLVATLGEERFSADAPKSTVLAQLPAAGESVARGAKVALDVSAGQQRSVIPSLAGLTQGDAGQAIKRAGLTVGSITEEKSDSTRGLVLASRPPEGQGVPAGTRVDLVVSAGPQELTVPDVVGRDEESATVLLRQLGFTVAPVERDSESALQAGTVISQTPAAGTPSGASATIKLKVSAKP
jgi:serine/threonine-protein kinase